MPEAVCLILGILVVIPHCEGYMRTPLYEEQLRMGAKMTEFAGWEMPMYYSGIMDEARAVRRTAGIFDLSHMGEIGVIGSMGVAVLDILVTVDMCKIGVGRAAYSLMCGESGGIVDDLIIYRKSENEYLLVVNASNVKKDLEWIDAHKTDGADIVDRSQSTGLIAIQGPKSRGILAEMIPAEHIPAQRFRINDASIAGANVMIASTGYTGGPGYEIYCRMDDLVSIWNSATEIGNQFEAVPCGLGARDVLRIEAGYPLYDHELSESISPVEARLMWVVDLRKNSFVGKAAIQMQQSAGVDRLRVGLISEGKCIGRAGNDILVDGRPVGVITSGTFSPNIESSIAMGYIDKEHSDIGAEVLIETKNRRCNARIVGMPFYPVTVEG